MKTLLTIMGNCILVFTAFAVSMTLIIGCASSRQDVQCPKVEVSPSGDPGTSDKTVATPPLLDYTKKLDGVTDIDQAVEKVNSALADKGFGVVTDMDIQTTMKKKLDVEMRPYRILGACNPKLAYRAIENEKTMGLLLPCKVVVYQNEDGSFMVSFARPKTVFTLIDNSDLVAVAEEVDRLIRGVYESL